MQQTIDALSTRKMASAERSVDLAVKVAAAMVVTGGDPEKLAALLEADGMDKEALGAILGGLARAGGAALRGLGSGVSAAGRMRMPTTGTQRLMAASNTAPKAPGMFAGNTQRMLHAGGEAVPQGPGMLQRAGGWLQQKGQQVAAAAPTAQPKPAAQPASRPLIGAGTKLKMLGGAAALGTGYVGYKGLQTARDYMMAPPHHSSYGTPMAHDVNQYGYPQF